MHKGIIAMKKKSKVCMLAWEMLRQSLMEEEA
jgi:hypothetical protein